MKITKSQKFILQIVETLAGKQGSTSGANVYNYITNTVPYSERLVLSKTGVHTKLKILLRDGYVDKTIHGFYFVTNLGKEELQRSE